MRAQISVEFMTIFTVIAIILLVFVMIYSNQTTNLLQSKDILAAKKIAYLLSGAINNVYLAGNGTTYELQIVKSNENITISNNNVVVAKNKIKVSMPLITESINTTEIRGSKIKIKNNNGLIEIATS